MKIDKRDPMHWLLLAGFFLQAVLGTVWRGVGRKRERNVVLYGHKLNGNLLALYRYMAASPEAGLRPVFLTMDRAYRDELRASGIESCWASGLACVRLLGTASALVSDHGLHAMQPLHGLYRRLGLRFFDVWHGIPFKGFDADDFRLQHRYDEVWVASELNRRLYLDRFGFDAERVVATGYPRTDRLLDHTASNTDIRRALGLPACGKLLLFAPTWAQDDRTRSIYPFGTEESEFLGAVAELAGRHGATVLLRSHLNTMDSASNAYPGVVALPGGRYPDTEAILLVSDVVVCDWSSIAFDYLLLGRPTLFLDVEPPFRKGFSLGPEYRFGPVVRDLPGLLQELEGALSRPEAYLRTYSVEQWSIRQQVYGNCADGRAAARCVQRLQAHLLSGGG